MTTGRIAKHWIGEESVGGEAEARAAVAAARQAFETTSWSRDRSLRHKALLKMPGRFESSLLPAHGRPPPRDTAAAEGARTW